MQCRAILIGVGRSFVSHSLSLWFEWVDDKPFEIPCRQWLFKRRANCIISIRWHCALTSSVCLTKFSIANWTLSLPSNLHTSNKYYSSHNLKRVKNKWPDSLWKGFKKSKFNQCYGIDGMTETKNAPNFSFNWVWLTHYQLYKEPLYGAH